jgi:hypothetical protein
MRVDAVVLIVFTVVLSSCCAAPVDRRVVVRDWYACLDTYSGRDWIERCQ